MMTNTIIAHTDGACKGNPGPGGWAIVFHQPQTYEIVSGFEQDTTNNKMELLAVVNAVMFAYENGFDRIVIYTDSSYVYNAINLGWLVSWKLNKWNTKRGEPVKNQQLWQKLFRYIYGNDIKVKVNKVKAHTGDRFNEMADKAAKNQILQALKR